MAYATLKGMVCPPVNHLSGQTLGAGVLTSLPPGVYCFDTTAQLAGKLTLTGAGPWVFQIGTALTTATASEVAVADPGTTCSGSNVFWQIGSSATLGTGTKFTGNVVALASITATTGVSVSGSLSAITAAVTLDTNSISACRSAAGGPVLPPVLDKCDADHDKHGDDDRDDGDRKHHGEQKNEKDHKDSDTKSKDADAKGRKRG
jgi:hypothetical protein